MSQMDVHFPIRMETGNMDKYVYTYHSRLTNALSFWVVAVCRKDADILAADTLEKAYDLGISMPSLHSFEYVTEQLLKESK